MRILTLLAISTISLSAAPALAQGAMNHNGSPNGAMQSDNMMKMSDTDMKMMKRCKAMPEARMKKNKGCMNFMKMHPHAMTGGAMNHNGSPNGSM